MRTLEVYAHYLPHAGGVEMHIHDLCECLKSQGHQVTVLTYGQKGSRFEIIDGIGVQRVKIPSLLLLARFPGIIVLLIMFFAFRFVWKKVHKNK